MNDADEVIRRAEAEYGIVLDAERAQAIQRTTSALMALARKSLGRIRFEDEPADFKTTLGGRP